MIDFVFQFDYKSGLQSIFVCAMELARFFLEEKSQYEENEIIQVGSQAKHACLNALHSHPIVSLFYLFFKICQPWKFFLYIMIFTMGYMSSFSYL